MEAQLSQAGYWVRVFDRVNSPWEKGPYEDVTNLWVKRRDGSIGKIPISDPVYLNDAPIVDLRLFEEKNCINLWLASGTK